MLLKTPSQLNDPAFEQLLGKRCRLMGVTGVPAAVSVKLGKVPELS